MIHPEIYKEILREYEELRDNSKRVFEKKKEICYNKCPRIREIDEELNMTAIKISKSIISVNKEDKKEYIDKIKVITNNLKKEKNDLMKENGFYPSYFDEIYNCQKCKDTGFINNEKCECFKQKLINRAYNMSNISEIIKSENFSSFSLDYYSKNIDKQNNMSPYENMKLILRKCSIFIEEFGEKFKNMVFFGDPGLGKTFLCRCIAKELLDRGNIILYVSAFQLFNMFEKYRFSKDKESVGNEILKLTKEADLLILDDLGTEFITNISTTELFNIINTRILNKKSTIISTNLETDEIINLYSGRILSRLYGEYDMLKFFGDDIRIKKNLKKLV